MTYRRGDERPVLNIEGGFVALGPLRRDLLGLYQRWINDLEAARGLGAFLPSTVEKETGWYESQTKSESDITECADAPAASILESAIASRAGALIFLPPPR